MFFSNRVSRGIRDLRRTSPLTRYFTAVALAASLCVAAASRYSFAADVPAIAHDYPIQSAPIGSVYFPDVANGGSSAAEEPYVWRRALEALPKLDLNHAIAEQEATGELPNFRRAAGKLDGTYQGARSNDSDVFKVIEGACDELMYLKGPLNPARNSDLTSLTQRIDMLVDLAVAAQQANGYLVTSHIVPYPEGKTPTGGAGQFVDERLSHELYSMGHMIEGAIAHNQATGSRKLYDAALKAANLICTEFAPGKRNYPPGHEEIELALCKLYRYTGEKKYLDTALYLVSRRGDPGHRSYGSYAQDHAPVAEQTEAVGHSVRALYLYSGMTDVAQFADGTRAPWRPTLDTLWNDVIGRKMYVTGGIGAKPSIEGFGADYELPNDTAYAETCAQIANVLWNDRMFRSTGDGKFQDVIERELLNGILVGRSPEGNLYYYGCPQQVNSNRSGRSAWFSVPCCPTNVVRFIPQIGSFFYSTRKSEHDETLFVNQYGRSEALLKVGGQNVKVTQETNYPWDGKITLTVSPEKPANFFIKLRVPSWARNQPVPGGLYSYVDKHEKTDYSFDVDGGVDEMYTPPDKDGYISFSQEWKPNTKVHLNFNMALRRVVADERVSADAGAVALERGPIVYALSSANRQLDSVFSYYLPDDATLPAASRPDGKAAHTLTVPMRRVPQALISSLAPGTSTQGMQASKDEAIQVSARPYYLQTPPEQSMTIWISRTADRATSVTAAAARPRGRRG